MERRPDGASYNFKLRRISLMDIFSHAVAGACTGFAFGRPVLGAIIAVIPDIPIFGPRRDTPPYLYKFTHSLVFLFIFAIIGSLFELQHIVFFCLASHLVLDITTHGDKWYPRLLWPINYRIYCGVEWEFYNRSWQIGACITFIWCSLWLFIGWWQ